MCSWDNKRKKNKLLEAENFKLNLTKRRESFLRLKENNFFKKFVDKEKEKSGRRTKTPESNFHQ